ncbi:VOC family protein [Sorangium sp. So ce1128]
MEQSLSATPPVSPYLTVGDAKGAIDFYTRAFGAREMSRMAMPNSDRIMHAAVLINGGLVMLADDFPEYSEGKSLTPKALGGTSVTIHLNLPDVDAAWKQAVDAGAKVIMPLADMFWGDRYGVLEDPYGHRWSLATTKQQLTPEQMQENLKKSMKS